MKPKRYRHRKPDRAYFDRKWTRQYEHRKKAGVYNVFIAFPCDDLREGDIFTIGGNTMRLRATYDPTKPVIGRLETP